MPALAQQQHVTTSEYMGITIYKGWTSSNFIGTVRHYATLPNGNTISSPERSHVTKRIRKFFKANS